MTEPATAAQLLQQGLFHHRQGDIAQAMERYTEVLRNDPNNADALYYVAVVACHEGQFQQGIELARRSLTFRPRQARAHNVIGQAFHRLGQIKDALASFDDALHGMGRLDEAIASYDRAIALDAEFAVSHFNRANALKDRGRLDDALAGYDRAIALAAQFAEAHSGRALALKGLGRLDEALAAADRAIELKADMPVAHKARADVLQALGRADEARVSAERAAALESQAPPAPSQGP